MCDPGSNSPPHIPELCIFSVVHVGLGLKALNRFLPNDCVYSDAVVCEHAAHTGRAVLTSPVSRSATFTVGDVVAFVDNHSITQLSCGVWVIVLINVYFDLELLIDGLVMIRLSHTCHTHAAVKRSQVEWILGLNKLSNRVGSSCVPRHIQ
jgi:hypothetical protein